MQAYSHFTNQNRKPAKIQPKFIKFIASSGKQILGEKFHYANYLISIIHLISYTKLQGLGDLNLFQRSIIRSYDDYIYETGRLKWF